MSCFTTVTAVTAGADLDLTKHVNYTAGMILGVDDFTQEFAYLAGRDRWLAREAIGYGTISGLKVSVEKDGANGWRVFVAPGVAISPRGQLICVSSAQCAYLNQWLAAADTEELTEHLNENITSPPTAGDELKLYVVLCYRDCPTDNVPIPGEPCRNENELTAASRIKDDFSLELRFEPPKQAEEDAVGKFAKRLKEIEIIETGTSTPLEDFLQALRDEFIPPVTSPPVTSPPITSPPVVLQILKEHVSEYMQAAFRLWVTELRTVLSERKTGCSVEMTGGGKLEDCVLLGEIKIPLVALSPGFKVSDSEDPLVNEENRPFLLHLRMLQEWLTGGGDGSGGLMFMKFAKMSGGSSSLKGLKDVELSAPVTDGQVLMFDKGHWTAKKIGQSKAESALVLPLATVTRRETAGPRNTVIIVYEVWINIDAPGNLAEIKEITNENLEIFNETESSAPFLEEIKFDAKKILRNVFHVSLTLRRGQAEPNFMRFQFSMDSTKVTSGDTDLTLLEYAEKHNIKFSGYAEKGKFASVFVRGADGKIG